MTAVFWFFFSTVVLIQSVRMGVGTLMNPGMGFMACGASGIMALLSLILLIQSLVRRRETEEPVHPFAGLLFGRVVGFVIAAFCIYPSSPFSGLSGGNVPSPGMPSCDRWKTEMVASYHLSCPEQSCELLCFRKAISMPVSSGYPRFLRGEPWVSFIMF